jgi:hypothetical protein
MPGRRSDRTGADRRSAPRALPSPHRQASRSRSLPDRQGESPRRESRAPRCEPASTSPPVRSEVARSNGNRTARRAAARPRHQAQTRAEASAPPPPPHIADPLPIRAPATASSASGSSVPTVAASDRGKPKSRTARREPVRSASFATPASANTPATTRRAINTAELTPRSVHERPTEISTPSLAPSLSSNPTKA